MFKGLFEWESDEAATARLAESPEGSINHALSKLPVTNPDVGMPGTMLVRLPRTGIIGLLRHSSHPSNEQRTADGKLIRSRTFHLTVLGGDHPQYPVGGYDIAVSEDEARRSQPITSAMLASLFEDA